MTRSTALVASGTDWISLVSARTSSMLHALAADVDAACLVDLVARHLGAVPVVLALDEGHRAEDRDLDGLRLRAESETERSEREARRGDEAYAAWSSSFALDFIMPRTDFVCAPTLRVRWAEVDMQKIVFNGHYLTYIDTAIAEYWREIGLPYPQGYVERYGSDIYLRKATRRISRLRRL